MQTLDRDEATVTINARPDVVYALSPMSPGPPISVRRFWSAHGWTEPPGQLWARDSRPGTGPIPNARHGPTHPS